MNMDIHVFRDLENEINVRYRRCRIGKVSTEWLHPQTVDRLASLNHLRRIAIQKKSPTLKLDSPFEPKGLL